ncbi:MAG: 3-dehydroquinate dehydratase [Actinobacteria bacterium]|jgi:3-dehydroquinate dehydratase-2|nr:3-dehydroquinate dehydratase [Actinomycetota bacterium]NBR65794.1 3-dehydroquinate dehydratase [Actinomycetota bacterium]NBU17108.1 3-dehydroquinate dehydratase [Actinomycetota bacterium]
MAPRSILVIHGPNLNLLGEREPQTYGTDTVDDHVGRVRAVAERSGVAVDSFLSNSESEIVSAVQGARAAHGAIIINAGALTHYSWALHDALRAFDGPKIEVHISNPGARESFRHTSVIAPVVNGTIAGFGGLGYDVAAHTAVALLG